MLHPRIRRAVRWLEGRQNSDGGWGEDCAPTPTLPGSAGARPRPRRRRGPCSALLAAGGTFGGGRAGGAAGWRDTQRADGTWDEPQFTGTGFPGDFYINYHLYRLVFPVSALGRFVRGAHGA